MQAGDDEAAAAVAAAEAAARPEDAAILAQEKELREQAEAAPLVGARESLDGLKAQYASNPGFLPKIDGLGHRFGAMRRTRPDGNCFYRAYMYGIFEALVGQAAPLTAFAARAKASLDFCVAVGYEKVAIEDFYEEFLSCLERLAAPGASGATVDELLAECDGYLICWARVLTSAYLRKNAEDYVHFLSSHSSIAEFCAQEVDPMAKDADHLQIAALSAYFGVPVRVVYLDRSEGDAAAEHGFQEDGKEGCPFKTVHLLYRPGHYDLIYPL